MSLRNDAQLARLLLSKPLSPANEKAARAAAGRVLGAITHLLFKMDNDLRGEDFIPDDIKGLDLAEILGELALLSVFLADLGFNIEPTSRPKGYTRKINFTDATQGSARTRAGNARHLAIALRVRELRKAKTKGAVRITAEEFNTVSSDVSRICNDPNIKEYLDFEETLT